MVLVGELEVSAAVGGITLANFSGAVFSADVSFLLPTLYMVALSGVSVGVGAVAGTEGAIAAVDADAESQSEICRRSAVATKSVNFGGAEDFKVSISTKYVPAGSKLIPTALYLRVSRFHSHLGNWNSVNCNISSLVKFLT